MRFGPMAVLHNPAAYRRTVDLDHTSFAQAVGDHYRRHMTKGQRAMAMAIIYPEAEKGGRGQKSSIPEGFRASTSEAFVSMARTVVKFTPEAVANVMSGARGA